jgi:hypothetical protein
MAPFKHDDDAEFEAFMAKAENHRKQMSKPLWIIRPLITGAALVFGLYGLIVLLHKLA